MKNTQIFSILVATSIFYSFPFSAYAEIYKCKDSSGKVTYSANLNCIPSPDSSIPKPFTDGEYHLEVEKSCSTKGDKIAFKCDKRSNQKSLVFRKDAQWYGRNDGSDRIWRLSILKDDEFILILDNPVFFSGKSIIYIMKPTRRFYWSEFAYSITLKEQEGTIRYGRLARH